MPKYNNPRRTWKYSKEFKVNAVQLSFTVAVGITINSVTEKLETLPFLLSVFYWIK
jgi:transposase